MQLSTELCAVSIMSFLNALFIIIQLLRCKLFFKLSALFFFVHSVLWFCSLLVFLFVFLLLG